MSSNSPSEVADAQPLEDAHAASKPLRTDEEIAEAALAYSKQSEKLSPRGLDSQADSQPADTAVEALFVTPQDPVIVTSSGNRLPSVSVSEAQQLNMLKDELQGGGGGGDSDGGSDDGLGALQEKNAQHQTGTAEPPAVTGRRQSRFFPFLQRSAGGKKNNNRVLPPSHTHPLFPPLPVYGPPSLFRSLQSTTFRVSSFFLSLSFLGVVVLGSLFTSVPGAIRRTACRLTLRDPDANRPFYHEEKRRREMRQEMDRSWKRRRLSNERLVRREGAGAGAGRGGGGGSITTEASASSATFHGNNEDPAGAGVGDSTYKPTEGGPDPLVPDVAHYARRVGLDVEKFEVQTEDGFIIDLWHVYDPNEQPTPRPPAARKDRGPSLLFSETTAEERDAIEQEMLAEPRADGKKPKFPVLLIHGLLQSSGAYCVNDDDSLAFYLCKSGYDVWLGNNRAGFHPKHATLSPADPRMWCWNIRHMGVFDLPALTSRVLRETRFARLGLVCHSQGTTEALVALAKEQRPELGRALTVFCALAPAAYAGRLVEKMYFKFMRIISPGMFRLLFGIHSFIPLMMRVHPILPGRLYGWVGYRVFSFLFDWSDARWERSLRDRMFQFAPVYVSAESMRWWLGREGFARHKCILATKEEAHAEDRDEEEEEEHQRQRREAAVAAAAAATGDPFRGSQASLAGSTSVVRSSHHRRRALGATAWYDEQVPPMALWVCGRDDLVDGRRLLKRFLPRPVFFALDHGSGSRSTSSGPQRSTREPHVRVVHAKFIPAYEHLDVLWAMDAVDEVFSEMREVLWKTCHVRNFCRTPKGCEAVEPWRDPILDQDSETEGPIVRPGTVPSTMMDEDDGDSSSSSSETDAA